jgi:hypothetical protein
VILLHCEYPVTGGVLGQLVDSSYLQKSGSLLSFYESRFSCYLLLKTIKSGILAAFVAFRSRGEFGASKESGSEVKRPTD